MPPKPEITPMERMLVAMIEQLGVSEINWIQLAEQLNEGGKGPAAALRMRYRRFKDRLFQDKKHDGPGGGSGGNGTGGNATSATTS